MPRSIYRGRHIVAVSTLLSCLLCAAAFSKGADAKDKTPTAWADKATDQYRRWKCVTPKPVHMAPQISLRCVGPSPQHTRNNPHINKHFRVYVNAKAYPAMAHEATPKFPVGSIIVKEKLASQKATTPELLTVMTKRQAGFDRANGDWEYQVLDGPTGKPQVLTEAKRKQCQSCHAGEKAGDYVFRDYFSPTVSRKRASSP